MSARQRPLPRQQANRILQPQVEFRTTELHRHRQGTDRDHRIPLALPTHPSRQQNKNIHRPQEPDLLRNQLQLWPPTPQDTLNRRVWRRTDLRRR